MICAIIPAALKESKNQTVHGVNRDNVDDRSAIIPATLAVRKVRMIAQIIDNGALGW